MDGPRTSPGHRRANELEYRRRGSRAPTPINQPSSSVPNRDERHPAAEFSDRATIGTRDQRGPGTRPRPMKNARPSTRISVNDVASCDGGGGGYNTRLVHVTAAPTLRPRYEANTQAAGDPRSVEVLTRRKPGQQTTAPSRQGRGRTMNRQRASPQQIPEPRAPTRHRHFSGKPDPGRTDTERSCQRIHPHGGPSGSRNRVATRRRMQRPRRPKTRSSATERDLVSAAKPSDSEFLNNKPRSPPRAEIAVERPTPALHPRYRATA